MVIITELFLAIWNFTNPVYYGVLLGLAIAIYPSLGGLKEKINLYGIAVILVSLAFSSVLNNVNGESEFAVLDRKDSSGNWVLQTERGTYITSPLTEVYYFSRSPAEFCYSEGSLSLGAGQKPKKTCYFLWITDPEKFAKNIDTLDKFKRVNQEGVINRRRALSPYFRPGSFPESLPSFVGFKPVKTGK